MSLAAATRTSSTSLTGWLGALRSRPGADVAAADSTCRPDVCLAGQLAKDADMHGGGEVRQPCWCACPVMLVSGCASQLTRSLARKRDDGALRRTDGVIVRLGLARQTISSPRRANKAYVCNSGISTFKSCVCMHSQGIDARACGCVHARCEAVKLHEPRATTASPTVQVCDCGSR